MKILRILVPCFIISVVGCQGNPANNKATSNVKVISAMKNVMWKGDLTNHIVLDTIANKKGLYGLGPATALTGELLINDGKSYVSKVTSDSTMQVERTYKAAAPFFVYANVTEWKELQIPRGVKSIKHLETFLNEQTKETERPFAFKLKGNVSKAIIHIQKLPKGTKVSSPKEAHQGQVNYALENEQVEIIGFFSTEHQGVFTHHDSFLHMHLITQDETKMGHLDELEIGNMQLLLSSHH